MIFWRTFLWAFNTAPRALFRELANVRETAKTTVAMRERRVGKRVGADYGIVRPV